MECLSATRILFDAVGGESIVIYAKTPNEKAAVVTIETEFPSYGHRLGVFIDIDGYMWAESEFQLSCVPNLEHFMNLAVDMSVKLPIIVKLSGFSVMDDNGLIVSRPYEIATIVNNSYQVMQENIEHMSQSVDPEMAKFAADLKITKTIH
jgi:hypothetical protein